MLRGMGLGVGVGEGIPSAIDLSQTGGAGWMTSSPDPGLSQQLPPITAGRKFSEIERLLVFDEYARGGLIV